VRPIGKHLDEVAALQVTADHAGRGELDQPEPGERCGDPCVRVVDGEGVPRGVRPRSEFGIERAPRARREEANEHVRVEVLERERGAARGEVRR
jgi:hypothetical protein